MTTTEVYDHLFYGKRVGARFLWLGGGEPTLRPDLLAILRKATLLGYERIRLETNGMRLAHDAFTRACVAAGLTEVNVALKSHRPEVHDRLTQTPGCHDLLLRGLAQCRRYRLPLEGDVLVYRETVAELPDLVRFYVEQGVRRFAFWLLSAVDVEGDGRDNGQGSMGEQPGPSAPADPGDLVRRQVPRLSELTDALGRVLEVAREVGLAGEPGVLTSYHSPPCTLAPGLESMRFFAPDLRLVVCNPGGHRFRLEESPIEGGAYLPSCARCVERQRCMGVRADYLALHGAEEFQPL